jgi:hypothetical protein
MDIHMGAKVHQKAAALKRAEEHPAGDGAQTEA